jgi:glycosyltransferase involved in cell wall biosynthesis
MRFTRRGCEVLSSTYGESIHPRFVVNPPGIDAPEICGRPGTGEAVRLLCVARLVPSKRISLILNALASFARYRWSLDIVGDGVCRQDLERQARQQGLEERIRFHGHQEALGPCYWQADLFLFPSELENCSLAMLEAMSYAVPCLAMKDDGVRFRNSNSEIIRDGIDGFLAASDEEFTTRLGSLLQEPSRILHAGMAARDHILAEHSWDEHLDVYEGLFLKLEKERRPISTRLCPSM